MDQNITEIYDPAIFTSASSLSHCLLDYLKLAPRPYIRILGTGFHGSEQREDIHFDMTIECSRGISFNSVTLQHSKDIGVSNKSDDALVITELADLDKPLLAWCDTLLKSHEPPKHIGIRHELAPPSDATLLDAITRNVQKLARSVLYGGTVTCTIHVAGQQVDVCHSNNQTDRSSEAMTSGPLLTALWEVQWLFAEPTVITTKEENSSWHERLRSAMVNRVRGPIALDDPVPQTGKSPLRQAMASRGVRTVSTTQDGEFRTRVVQMQNWGVHDEERPTT